ncbi:hypothetical protein NARC_70185 [Candidatus Nitrosocosmicus arcticus]|uniref:Uncharacterized protein n=1 Tax=Candidatus Nitrosocosmicus arcticus TaxID=2035267 RepID=A0A557SVI7_9ARCH|nr:hypothetical protein NARC_70185 [Candidatus Nitrosocosmicus arcticus]
MWHCLVFKITNSVITYTTVDSFSPLQHSLVAIKISEIRNKSYIIWIRALILPFPSIVDKFEIRFFWLNKIVKEINKGVLYKLLSIWLIRLTKDLFLRLW